MTTQGTKVLQARLAQTISKMRLVEANANPRVVATIRQIIDELCLAHRDVANLSDLAATTRTPIAQERGEALPVPDGHVERSLGQLTDEAGGRRTETHDAERLCPLHDGGRGTWLAPSAFSGTPGDAVLGALCDACAAPFGQLLDLSQRQATLVDALVGRATRSGPLTDVPALPKATVTTAEPPRATAEPGVTTEATSSSQQSKSTPSPAEGLEGDLLDLKAFAALLATSTATVTNWVSQGKIPEAATTVKSSGRYGRKKVWTAEQVTEVVSALETMATAQATAHAPAESSTAPELAAAIPAEDHDVKGLAGLLGCTPNTVRVWVRQGKIPEGATTVKSGGPHGCKKVWTADQVTAILASTSAGAAGAVQTKRPTTTTAVDEMTPHTKPGRRRRTRSAPMSPPVIEAGEYDAKAFAGFMGTTPETLHSWVRQGRVPDAAKTIKSAGRYGVKKIWTADQVTNALAALAEAA
jgi:predicted site-specific integrase-resolvase